MTARTDIASCLITAAPDAIYRTFIDPDALMAWLPPRGMTGRILQFEPWEGGRYRIELAYEGASGAGKSTARSDISGGPFIVFPVECSPSRRFPQ